MYLGSQPLELEQLHKDTMRLITTTRNGPLG
jgi:hypothetical protein